MLIIPAIDLLDGKVVRLFQGDFGRRRVFGDDPVSFAKGFRDAGASALHVVDLNGARTGKPLNFDAVRDIAREVPELFIEFGGGVRDEAMAERCFESGVGRVIIGTAALRDPGFCRRLAERFGDRLAVGVDARGGLVAVNGWEELSDADSVDFCLKMRDVGVKHVIYTDISRDGAGRGANIAAYERLRDIDGLLVTASGGVSSVGDVLSLSKLGLFAAIIGRALYTGELELGEAIEAAGG